jgi:hypothetical protein
LEQKEKYGQGIHIDFLVIKGQSLVMGIKSKLYPREGDIHVFQALSIVQKHGDEKNLRDKLLLADLGNSSSPECVNSW